MTIRHGLSAIGFLVFLAGCTSVQDPFLTASTSVAAPTMSSEVDGRFATVLLPGDAGRITTVRQVLREGYLQQSIVYENTTASAGENVLTVDFGTPQTASRYLHAPTKREIAAEIRRALPGIPMRISDTIGDNPQGVFGYATGPAGNGGSCLYAWQLAKGGRDAGASTIASTQGRRLSAQLRLRYCSATLPPERIATLMQGLRVKPVTRDTIEMLRFAEGSGAAAAAYQPAMHDLSQPTPHVGRSETAGKAGSRVRRTEMAADASVAAIRDAVTVPLPGGGAVTRTTTPASVGETRAGATNQAALVPLPD